MAGIVLQVEERPKTGTGNARAVRREDKDERAGLRAVGQHRAGAVEALHLRPAEQAARAFRRHRIRRTRAAQGRDWIGPVSRRQRDAVAAREWLSRTSARRRRAGAAGQDKQGQEKGTHRVTT